MSVEYRSPSEMCAYYSIKNHDDVCHSSDNEYGDCGSGNYDVFLVVIMILVIVWWQL